MSSIFCGVRMEIEFTSSFTRDFRRLRSAELRTRIDRIINDLESAAGIEAVPGAVRLKGPGLFYRIRVGDYRQALSLEGNTAIVTRFLHRRDIYRFFP